MAEFILKDMVRKKGIENDFHIESAAVSDEEWGNPIYPPAKACLTRHGIPFDKSKTSRKVTRADYARFDLLVYMDASNLRWLDRIIGDDPEGKMKLMMSYAGKMRDVADPWYTGDFERTYSDLVESISAMLESF